MITGTTFRSRAAAFGLDWLWPGNVPDDLHPRDGTTTVTFTSPGCVSVLTEKRLPAGEKTRRH